MDVLRSRSYAHVRVLTKSIVVLRNTPNILEFQPGEAFMIRNVTNLIPIFEVFNRWYILSLHVKKVSIDVSK